MDTTPASIAIRLHMEPREGHTTSDIRIKGSEINATERTMSGWRLHAAGGVKIQLISELNCT